MEITLIAIASGLSFVIAVLIARELYLYFKYEDQ